MGKERKEDGGVMGELQGKEGQGLLCHRPGMVERTLLPGLETMFPTCMSSAHGAIQGV